MNTPYYIERTANGANAITLESILLENRVIFLDKPIDGESVNSIIKQLLVLSAISNEKITILINTPGGSISDGLSLVDVIKACPCPICTVSLGIAASMGAIILAAGTKGLRFVSNHSRVMLHEPLIQSGIGGSCSSVQATAEALMERKKLINKLLCDYTGKDMKTINKATSFDNYLSAAAAVELGVVDAVLSDDELYQVLKGV